MFSVAPNIGTWPNAANPPCGGCAKHLKSRRECASTPQGGVKRPSSGLKLKTELKLKRLTLSFELKSFSSTGGGQDQNGRNRRFTIKTNRKRWSGGANVAFPQPPEGGKPDQAHPPLNDQNHYIHRTGATLAGPGRVEFRISRGNMCISWMRDLWSLPKTYFSGFRKPSKSIEENH